MSVCPYPCFCFFARRDGPKALEKEDLSVRGAYIYISPSGAYLREFPLLSPFMGRCDMMVVTSFFLHVLAMSYECHFVTARKTGDYDSNSCIAAIHYPVRSGTRTVDWF